VQDVEPKRDAAAAAAAAVGQGAAQQIGSGSSSHFSALDEDAASSHASDCEACADCGETDGDLHLCKGCNRLLHETCGGPGPCHKLCDSCSAALGKVQSKKGRFGMVEL